MLCWQDLKNEFADVQKERERASITTCEWYILQGLTKPESSKFHSRLRDTTSSLAAEFKRPWKSEINKELADIVETHLANDKDKEKKEKGSNKKDKGAASPKRLKRKKRNDASAAALPVTKKKRNGSGSIKK